MILSIMDLKKKLLCILFIDLYSPRSGEFAAIVLMTRFRELVINLSVYFGCFETVAFPGVPLSFYMQYKDCSTAYIVQNVNKHCHVNF